MNASNPNLFRPRPKSPTSRFASGQPELYDMSIRPSSMLCSDRPHFAFPGFTLSLSFPSRWTACVLLCLGLLAGAVLHGQTSGEAASLAHKGRAALDQGDFGAAVQLLEQADQLAPDDSQTATHLLLSYVQAGRI